MFYEYVLLLLILFYWSATIVWFIIRGTVSWPSVLLMRKGIFNRVSDDIVYTNAVLFLILFNMRSVSSLIVCRRQKFLTNFMDNRNSIGGAVSGLARRELNDLI